MRIVNQALPERAQPERNNHAIVQDLGRDVGLADVVLKVAHQEEVARREEAVVQRVVRDVAQHGAGTAAVVAMLIYRHAQETKPFGVVGLRVSPQEFVPRLRGCVKEGLDKRKYHAKKTERVVQSIFSLLPPWNAQNSAAVPTHTNAPHYFCTPRCSGYNWQFSSRPAEL